MAEINDRQHEDRGLSARHLILVFLAGVAVCGVFFSLGFLVGYNERAAKAPAATEQVTGPSAIPPVVNPPAGSEQRPKKEASSSATQTSPPSTTQAARNEPTGTAASPAKPLETEKVELGKTAPPAPGAATASSKPAKPIETTSTPTPAGGGEVGEGITVQVAASRTKEDAEALVQILKSSGYPVFLVTPEYAKANDNLFRVQVGPFSTREDAEKVRDKLARQGFKPFIRK